MKLYQAFLFLSFVTIFCTRCYYDNKEDLYQFSQTTTCVIADATYANDISQIMATECLSCHSNNDAQGGVNLEGYENVKKYVDDSSLYGSINHTGGFSIMPPSGVKIPACDIEKVKIWIDNGALNN